ncbi:cell cycle control protein 50C [Bombina bombina]|uniref:cell cycle control protein 50C n=1 Tax=Bombina bombina TaxID=8345 RepID=UPI00235AF02A|nr:cell cycle control protein 50C [Bombina bombina]
MKIKKVTPGEKSVPLKCPDNTAFKQQRLPSWKPSLNAQSVIPCTFIIAIFCLAVGISWIVTASYIKEIRINYSNYCTHCTELRENASNYAKPCNCIINFSVPEKIQGDVFIYYGLSNFHQNLRRYVVSRYDSQLLGENVTNTESIQKHANCAPFTTYSDGTPMAPCGATANSMFNDTITLLYRKDTTSTIQVPLLRTGNTWWTDKNVKFKNPEGDLTQAFAGTGKPPYWQKPAYLLDPDESHNNAYINDDFINWMRVAAFPTFKKLYRRLSRVQQFSDGLPAGNYSYSIEYNFVVSKIKGQKHVILTTLSWCGGCNMFLGVAYTVTGGVLILASVFMYFVHLKRRKREKSYFKK